MVVKDAATNEVLCVAELPEELQRLGAVLTLGRWPFRKTYKVVGVIPRREVFVEKETRDV
jgi:hypothetical protein